MHNNETPDWWDKTTKIILSITASALVIYFFSTWAINAEGFGKYNHSNTIGYGIISILSFLILLCAIPVAAFGTVAGLFLKYPFINYIVTLVISVTSVYYINTFHS